MSHCVHHWELFDVSVIHRKQQEEPKVEGPHLGHLVGGQFTVKVHFHNRFTEREIYVAFEFESDKKVPRKVQIVNNGLRVDNWTQIIINSIGFIIVNRLMSIEIDPTSLQKGIKEEFIKALESKKPWKHLNRLFASLDTTLDEKQKEENENENILREVFNRVRDVATKSILFDDTSTFTNMDTDQKIEMVYSLCQLCLYDEDFAREYKKELHDIKAKLRVVDEVKFKYALCNTCHHRIVHILKWDRERYGQILVKNVNPSECNAEEFARCTLSILRNGPRKVGPKRQRCAENVASKKKRKCQDQGNIIGTVTSNLRLKMMELEQPHE